METIEDSINRLERIARQHDALADLSKDDFQYVAARDRAKAAEARFEASALRERQAAKQAGR